MKMTEHFSTRGLRRILDGIRRHERLTALAMFLLLVPAVIVSTGLLSKGKKRDVFHCEGDPLDVRLAGIRFGWGNAIFDPVGSLAGAGGFPRERDRGHGDFQGMAAGPAEGPALWGTGNKRKPGAGTIESRKWEPPMK